LGPSSADPTATAAGVHGCHTAEVGSSSFNGVPIHDVRPDLLVREIFAMVSCGRSHVIHFLAADPLTIARRSDRFASTLRRADLNVADGLPLVWAIRAVGGATARITATDGLLLTCAAGVARGTRHYFFGGSDTTLRALERNLVRAHPGLQVVGTSSPPYRPLSDSELAAAASEIRAANTEILWIGLGAPKQNVVAEQLREHQAAPVIITVGAAFDFVGGSKRRAPRWMQKVGLEWLFRMLQEPRRLGRRYILGNSRFVVDAARAVWLAHRPGGERRD
jgi:N-acetylglucosaminyldiphosphoundecaprenol N-acetyl-beta-D-mannosaminyltransferase